MKKLIFFALVSLFLTSTLFGAEKQIVKAKIKNLKDSEIVVRVYDITGKQIKLDTTIRCKNGRFTFKRQFSEPVFATFVPQSGLLDTKQLRGVVEREAMTIELFLLENEKYTITGNVNGNTLLYHAEGSEINSILSKLKSKYIDAYAYRDMENEYFRDNKSKRQRDSVYMIGESIIDKMKAEKFEYVKNNLNSQLSGLFLSEQDYTTFDNFYTKINDNVRNGLFKPQIDTKKRYADLAQNSTKMTIGADEIDFTLKGLDDNSITLSSLKGGYVLLYFWGSW